METNVEGTAANGRTLEAVAKFNENASIYTHVEMKSQDGSSSMEGWLKFMVGPKRYRQVDENEWAVYIEPESRGGDWRLLQADVLEVVRQTFGKKGWTLYRIDRIRVRGNISLAYISIYE